MTGKVASRARSVQAVHSSVVGLNVDTFPTLTAGVDGSRTTIRATPAGCLFSIDVGPTLVNQVLANPLAGGLHRLYLRTLGADDVPTAREIVGPESRATFTPCRDHLQWSGSVDGLDYVVRCALHPAGRTWFFEVAVTNRSALPVRFDAIMLQDVGIASRGQIRTNELFTSQYLDHQVHRHTSAGFVTLSRQNLPQDAGQHPWIMHGCLPGASGVLTDGFAFFGLDSKAGTAPVALERRVIGTSAVQSETGWISIQSNPVQLAPGQTDRVAFFARFEPHHPEPSGPGDLSFVDEVAAQRTQVLADLSSAPTAPLQARSRSIFQSPLLPARELTPADITALLPGVRRHEEFVDGALHSFFYGTEARHVVLRAKELTSMRPHGHIMRSGKGFMPDDEVVSCAFYAAGVFGSQLTCGNTSLAKLLSPARDPLNLLRASGLRLFIRLGGEKAWQQLGVPSAFEMALDQCRWLYKHDHGTVIVTCDAHSTKPMLIYSVEATGRAIEVLATAELAAAPAEYESPVRVRIDEAAGRITVRPGEGSFLHQKQPELNFVIRVIDTAQLEAIGGAELLCDSPQGEPCVALQSRATHAFSFCIAGAINGEASDDLGNADPATLSETSYWRSLRSHLTLAHPADRTVAQLQDALTWFSRDAVIHLANPRGLEQANGGAWGVRDVCQGPVEFLLAYDHPAIVNDILKAVYAQQYLRRGDWPQWFMFPPYQQIQSRHCHGDVMVWPLKALCDYLEQTNDFTLLDELLPYTDDDSLEPTRERQSMVQHVDRQITRFRSEFLPGYSLPCYGDGDWDDSLQPADPSLRKRMVSAWTSALMFQTLKRWSEALRRHGDERRSREASSLADDIQTDFQKHLAPDGIVAGFAVFDEGSTDYLLHPRDRRTGLKYRLIPMTRGILSGIFTPRQAETHLELIRTQLLYPDGARLMDRPTAYDGGRERIFRRAESASYFGREIGLMYVHAHLRYAEAMATLGRADELWRAVQVANPITVSEVLANANARQRNCYFTSSDAAFIDRQHASRDYPLLRDGQVRVDGGWRVYSSGPGLFANVVVRHMLGLRTHYDCIDFDPVLPPSLDGLTCDVVWRGHPLQVTYRNDPTRSPTDRVRVNGMPVTRHRIPAESHYRSVATRLPIAAFRSMLRDRGTANSLEVAF